MLSLCASVSLTGKVLGGNDPRGLAVPFKVSGSSEMGPHPSSGGHPLSSKMPGGSWGRWGSPGLCWGPGCPHLPEPAGGSRRVPWEAGAGGGV